MRINTALALGSMKIYSAGRKFIYIYGPSPVKIGLVHKIIGNPYLYGKNILICHGIMLKVRIGCK